MQQWQVTAGQTVAVVNGERSLDAVAAFHALHPNAGTHVYATPVNGTLTRLGNLNATMDAVLADAARPRKAQTKVAPTAPVATAAPAVDRATQVAAVKASRPAKVKVAKVALVAKQAEVWAGEVETVVPVAPKVKVAPTVAVATAAPSRGVIGAMLALLADGTRRTRTQLYEALATQFPDRASAEGGMRVTIGVQLVALVKKGHNIVSAGAGKDRVYYILQD